MKISNFKSNFYSGLTVIFFSMFFIMITSSEVPLYEASDAMSPRFIPYVVLALLLLLGLWLVASSLIFKFKNNKTVNEEKIKKEKKSHLDLVIFIGLSFFILIFAKTIGFTFAAVISLVTALIFYGVKPWYKAFLVGVTIPLLIEISYRFLEIYLPLGFWEEIIYIIVL